MDDQVCPEAGDAETCYGHAGVDAGAREMSRRQRRRGARPRRRTFPEWAVWTAGGLAAAVVVVLIVVAAAGVFGGGESDALTANQMAEQVATGQSLGSLSAPVTILEFGDFQ